MQEMRGGFFLDDPKAKSARDGRNSCSKFVRDAFLREPRRSAFLGASLLLLGLVGLWFTVVFSVPNTAAARWLDAAFSCITVLGPLLMLLANIVFAPIHVLKGTSLLLLGLVLRFIGVVIGAAQHPTGLVASRVLSLVGISLILLAIVFFLLQGHEDWRRPVLGAHNYFLFGALSFGTGALCLFLAALRGLGNVAVDYVSPGLEPLGAGFLYIGSLFIWLAAARVNNNSENFILNRFPSTSILKDSLVGAKEEQAAAILSVIGFFVGYCALIFAQVPSSQFWGLFSGLVVVSASYLLFCAAHFRTRSFLFGISNLFTGSGLACYTISIGLRALQTLSSYFVVGIVGASLAILGDCIRFISAFKTYSSPLTSVGNFQLAVSALRLLGHTALLVEGALALSSSAVPRSIILLGVALRLVADVFLLLHSSMSLDVAQVLAFTGPVAEKYEVDATVPPELYLPVPDDWEGLETTETDVLVVGAGPAGLTLGNELGIRSVKTMIVEIREGVVPDSRFFAVNSATAEGHARLGLVQDLVDAGQDADFGWGCSFTSGMAHKDTRCFARMQAPSRNLAQERGAEGSRLDASRSVTSVWASQQGDRCMQSAQEQVLVDGVLRFDSVDLRFGHRLLAMRLTEGGGAVCLVVSQKDQRRFLVEARFVVGCDGPTSVVSSMLRTRYDGFVKMHSSRSVFFRAPTLLEKVLPITGPGHQFHIVRRGVGVGYFAMRDAQKHLWTFHAHGRYGGGSFSTLSKPEMATLLAEFIGPGVDYDVITDGRWRWGFSVARTMAKGQTCFLVGDAAHQWPPFAGMGGNTAYQDATNLGWKLSAVINGWGGDALLSSYQQERRDQCLRVAMGVATMTPDPKNLLTAGTYVWGPLHGLIKARWYYGNSGEHGGNHYASGGIQLGQRYDFSPITVGGNSASQPPEDPLCNYIPKVCTGGRVLHVQMPDGKSIHESLAMDGFTLVVATESPEIDQCVSALEKAFAQATVPLLTLRVPREFRAVKGRRNRFAASKWIAKKLVICRPDLYVSWVYSGAGVLDGEAASLLVGKVSGRALMSKLEEKQAASSVRWLTMRYVETLNPFQVRFHKGEFVINEPRAQNEATKADTDTGFEGNDRLFQLEGDWSATTVEVVPRDQQ